MGHLYIIPTEGAHPWKRMPLSYWCSFCADVNVRRLSQQSAATFRYSVTPIIKFM